MKEAWGKQGSITGYIIGTRRVLFIKRPLSETVAGAFLPDMRRLLIKVE